jgi:hypothetical protein
MTLRLGYWCFRSYGLESMTVQAITGQFGLVNFSFPVYFGLNFVLFLARKSSTD